MSALSNYLENNIIDWLLRGQVFSPPATLYFALFTSDPTDADSGAEVSGGNYARVGVTASLANFAGTQGAGTTTASSGTSGQTSNNAPITFPTPSANWGSVTHWGIYDAATNGNLLIHAALTTPKTVNNGDPAPYFDTGDMTITVA